MTIPYHDAASQPRIPGRSGTWKKVVGSVPPPGSFSVSRYYRFTIYFLLILAGPLLETHAAVPVNLGIFQAQSDVGNPALAGSAQYDATDQEYRIRGAGANMWFDRDEFHYVWRRLSGDFVLRTQAQFRGDGVEPHRKLGWMVRSTLEADSPHVNATVHGDGLTSLQFRRTAGGDTEEITSPLRGAEVIQLERRGDTMVMGVARFGEPLTRTEMDTPELGKSIYVGLYVCSHNPEVMEEAAFRNVRIVVPAPDDLIPYREYLGSRLEVMEIATGHRRVVMESPDSVQAPNWTSNGKSLIYNRNGRLYRFDLDSKSVSLIDTGFATRNNNDHVLSFDGRYLGISHHDETDEGRSNIFVLPTEGGTPKRITSTGPAYLHGWSPDNSTLVYTAERNREFDVYSIPVQGGPESRLTTAPGLDDGPEFSPNGDTIYFNSERSGRMKIWRMNPDGTEPRQLTHDAFNDWFPHVSPNGRWVVFLSFDPSTKPADHPFYRQVYLRLMPAGGGTPKVIGYIYGGQGTLNVPSWSPDSTRIAYVSNSGPLPGSPPDR